jgi:two-component system chemotaxis response regulator CheB
MQDQERNHPAPTGHDIIVIGASAGGVEALGTLVGGLPADLEAAIFVVLHVSPNGFSALPAILTRRGPLPAVHPAHGEPIRHGRIYIAPPDHHLLLRDDNGFGHIHLARGPRENGHRPAVDVLFRSAAAMYGPRVVGVVLSGALDDGTAGLVAVTQLGGSALVQDPVEALASSMPRSAADHVPDAEVLPLAGLADAIVRHSKEPAPSRPEAVPHDLTVENKMGALGMDVLHADDRPGEPSGFSCPDCGGVLWELQDSSLTRFRCRVGHAWSSESLIEQQYEALEASLWVALRSLEERSALSHRLRDRSMARGLARSAERFQEQADDAERAAEQIRSFLLGRVGGERWDGAMSPESTTTESTTT